MSSFIETLSGEIISTACLSNRAFLYGDGVFTTLRLSHGSAELEQLHWQRLRSDSRKLNINTPPFEYFKFCLHKTLQLWEQQDNEDDGIVRITVFRNGGRGYRNISIENGLIHISIQPLLEASSELKLQLVKTRLSQNELLGGIKHLNRLEQVLAANELRADADEALMLDTSEFVIEGTMSNIFWFADGEYYTPEINLSGVNGLARRKIIEGLQNRNKPLKIGRYPIQSIYAAENIWMCNAVRGIMDVFSIDSQEFLIDPNRTTFLNSIFAENLS